MTEQERLERLQKQLQLEDQDDSRHTSVVADLSEKSRAELEEDLNENKWKKLYHLVPKALEAFEDILEDENASNNDRRQVAESVLDRAGLVKKREVVVEETGIDAKTLMEAFAGMAKVFGVGDGAMRNVTRQETGIESSYEEHVE